MSLRPINSVASPVNANTDGVLGAQPSPPPTARPTARAISAPVNNPPGGLAVDVVRDGVPQRSLNGYTVRDGVIQADAGPILSQDYARTAQNGVTHPRDVLGDSSVSRAGCGQTTAAVMLQRYGHFSNEGAADDHMRVPRSQGGSIFAVADYYRMRGLQAQVYNGGSWEDLRRALAQGYGVEITLTHEQSPHTITVTAMFTGSDGKDYIQLMDVKGSGTRVMSRDTFMEQWDEVKLFGLRGLHTGITRTYTLVGPKGSSLPGGGSLWGEMNALSSLTFLDGVNDFANSFRYFAEGEVWGGVARLLDGTIQTSLQLPAVAVQAVGAGLEWLAEKPVDFALDILRNRQASFWEKLGAVLLLVLTGPLLVATKLVRYTGQLLGCATGLLARVLSFPFSKLADWLHEDNDATSAVRYSNFLGTPREQENWRRLRDNTPVQPGKVYLVKAMLSGHVNDEERRMVLRVLSSCARSDDRIDPDSLRSLVEAVGQDRLERTFSGSAEATEWNVLKAVLSAPPPAPMLAARGQPTSTPASSGRTSAQLAGLQTPTAGVQLRRVS